MKRIAGIFFGILYVVFVTVTVRWSMAGWAEGHADLGFWWAVISVFLALAGGSAVVGSFIHARIDKA